jgi:hypothetical protein
MKTIIIKPRQGFTGKDHLLPEIARQAQATNPKSKKAAEKAWFSVCRSRELYRGCEGGYGVEVK